MNHQSSYEIGGFFMNGFMLQLVNQKVNTLTVKELLGLAHQYQIPLSLEQARKVIAILRSETIDVANASQVNRIIHRLQTEVDPHVSSVIEQLLHQFGHLIQR